MALYLSLVLAGEFAAVADSIDTKQNALAMIWGTTLGLTAAHIFAFNLAARLFEGGRFSDETRVSITYQVALAVAVATLLSFPLLIAPVSTALDVSTYLVAATVGVTAFAVARAGDRSHAHSAGFAVAMLGLAVLVVLAKALFSG